MAVEQAKGEQVSDGVPTRTRAPRRRRHALAALLLVAVVAAGTCALRHWRAGRGLTEHRLLHGEQTRTYFVHLPPDHSADRPAPLVLALHGGGGSGRGFDASLGAGMQAEADRRGWVVVFPDGIAHGWNDGRPPTTTRAEERREIDDVGFIAALIDELHTRYGIDRRRIYATGISNGGFLCQRLAIELSDRLAAVASVTASLPRALEGERPRQPVGMMLLNGTADPLVPYEGGSVAVLGRSHGEVLSTDATYDWWRRHNGCSAEPSEHALPDRSPDDGTTVSVRTVDDCLGKTRVHRYRIEGGGHSWPGGRAYLPASAIGRVSRDIDATALIFDFFAVHVREPT